MKELKNKKKLKPIHINIKIEKEFKKALSTYTRKLNKSLEYWLLAQFNKYKRDEIKNLATGLRIEFSALKEQHLKNSDFAKNIALFLQKKVIRYVNANYKMQGFKKDSVNDNIQQVIKASYYNNVSLIKSIPVEIIGRLENSLYPAIVNYDLNAVKKILKDNAKISQNRVNTIARDQTAKAIESYTMARAKDLGFQYYTWITSSDERVSRGKGGHIYLHNRIYSYDTPTAIIDSYGTKGHPTQRVNCRCVQVPLFLEVNQKLKKVKDSEHGDYFEIIEK